MSAPLTIASIAEYVAFEAGKTVDEVLHSKRCYDVWLRRLVVWLARHLGGLSLNDIRDQTGYSLTTASRDVRLADQLYQGDAEFVLQAGITRSALTAIDA